jgi:hypothetical protein
MNHLVENNYLSSNQHGFRKNYSTNSALIKIGNEICRAIDESQSIIAITCDLSKAFDCVDHGLLLDKLRYYGMRGRTLHWFNSYLHERKQRTCIKSGSKNYYSEWELIKKGVPQGSILGPLLFVLYVNDLPINISPNTIQYADDTTVLVKESDHDRALDITREMVGKLNKWFAANGLKLNTNKSGYINFRTAQSSKYIHSISIEGQEIELLEHINLLGIKIDSHLKWSEHAIQLCKRLNTTCYQMARLSKIVGHDTKLTFYHGCFYPIMKYGIILWGSSSEAKSVFILQKKIVRYMGALNKRSSCRPVFKKYKILTLFSVYIWELLCNVRRNLHTYYQENANHDYGTRNGLLISIPQHRLQLYKQCPYYMGIKVYNKLPNDLKNVSINFDIFKAKIKQILLDKTYYSIQEYLDDTISVNM